MFQGWNTRHIWLLGQETEQLLGGEIGSAAKDVESKSASMQHSKAKRKIHKDRKYVVTDSPCLTLVCRRVFPDAGAKNSSLLTVGFVLQSRSTKHDPNPGEGNENRG